MIDMKQHTSSYQRLALWTNCFVGVNLGQAPHISPPCHLSRCQAGPGGGAPTGTGAAPGGGAPGGGAPGGGAPGGGAPGGGAP